MAHLVGRPVHAQILHPGRETALQPCTWSENGWLSLRMVIGIQRFRCLHRTMQPHPFEPSAENGPLQSTSSSGTIGIPLRIPPIRSCAESFRSASWLLVLARDGVDEFDAQAEHGRPETSGFQCEAETCLEFAPDHPQARNMAGLILYYDTQDYLPYLRVILS